jgi:hypothetical protein
VRPRFEVADLVRVYGDDYRRVHGSSAAHNKVLRHLAACRTAALGGHVDECDACDHVRISYNSCRDRHCPKCQGSQRAAWLAQRLERLLPVPYFHVVFTLPGELSALALRNKAVVFSILFRTAAATLRTIAADSRHLGAEIGFTALLHTWGQNLLFHPHLHCVVTGGGLSADGKRWVHGSERFFLPVRVLAKLFRGKFLAALHRAWTGGQLALAGTTAELAEPTTWRGFKDRLYRKQWVVYSKPPFGGPEVVFRYLGRYTHRVALANHRIVEVNDGRVTFAIRDHADSGRRRLLTLDAVEFLRRFLLHVLPKNLVRIRHYGLSAGRNLCTKLALAQRLLHKNTAAEPPAGVPRPSKQPWWIRFFELTGIDMMACPACTSGRLVRTRRLSSRPATPGPVRPPPLALAGPSTPVGSSFSAHRGPRG